MGLPESDLFIAGRMGEDNYKSIVEMLNCFKKDPKNAKKTVMVFPGVTRAYLTLEQAKAFLS